MYSTWENAIALCLTYLPFALLFLYAFHKNLRFNKEITFSILLISVIIRVLSALFSKTVSSSAVIICNYVENIVMILFGLITVKARLGRLLFTGLILKNTADAIVIFAKFAEHLVTPKWADVGYHWTYSVSLAICELIILPMVYLFIKKFFTNEIRDTISRRWRILWLIPFFFYLSWIYTFYYATEKTDLEQACLPINSAYLLLSIFCQYLIYACIATLVESLQKEARLQNENHIMQLQNIQFEYIRNQIEEDRRLRHDMRHHLITMEAYAKNSDFEKLTDYLEKYVTSSGWRSQIHYCANNVLNIMTSYFADKCFSNNIDLQVMLELPKELSLSDTEITILFGNLLENAFDACSEIEEMDNRRINFRGAVLNGSYVFSIENTYNGPVKTDGLGGFKSTKHSSDAIGIASCKDIVEKHGGSIEFQLEKLFQVNILIPGP